ncbi:MAG: hypothetical protein HYY37_03125 [Candidatus Aenigmarchaeota archaeon]|nr:hypothetical protein [Candidatus Aenigmarchaeota archaeon]
MTFHTALGIDINVLASFLFVFAIVYALLAYTKMFEGTKGASVVIALVIALFSAMYAPLVGFLVGILPIASILLVILFLFLFVQRVLMGGAPGADAVPIAVILGISLILIGTLWNSIWPLLPLPTTPDNMLWLIGIFLVLMLLYVVYRHGHAA